MSQGIQYIIVALSVVCLLLGSSLSALAETIKIGAIFAVTGPASFLGGPAARSAEMLVEQINQEGGINGQPIELIIKDSAGSSERAVSFARQLIEEERVVAIVGPSTSGESMAVKIIAEDARTPLISCAAAEVIVDPVARYVFKTPQKDSFAAQKIFAEMQRLGIDTIAIAAGNDGFGKAGKEQLEKLAPTFGITVAASETYDSKATDLSALVAKLKANPNIGALVNWSIVPAQAIIAKNIRQSGWDVPLFQSHGFGNIKYAEAAGVAAEGIIFPSGRLLVADSLPEDDPQKAMLIQYITEYETRFQEKASAFGGYAYDAVNIVVEAIRQAGNDREGVRDAIEGLQDFAGIGGVFSFSPEDHNGLDIDSFVMLTVKDGKFTLYERQ
ncbi:ABC transporter substrate-binding protein [Desulfobulbus alkaliphilus]|uniref:ABC transporter substrate-binding protein n=1 Tax=Desulfobulbus alkaliphilus TaxID=869814 RepID=UPI0019659988|nr:ABC transporter substrate-binding protein [Desulfobulbus alkaliphilus]MBM9536143.1 ABC transporter substrate-binding protein [Desulfobulbus alkaliphilus]